MWGVQPGKLSMANGFTGPQWVMELRQSRAFLGLVGLILLSAALAVVSPYFFTLSNILNVLRQVSVIAIVSVGMTIVIVTGGIDLAVGSVLALSSVFTAILLLRGFNVFLSAGAGLATGAALGLMSASLIASRARMPPFIATLAMLSMARGFTMVVTGGRPIYGLPAPFGFFGAGYLFGLPIPVVIMVIVFLVGHLEMSYSSRGIHYYAVGGNQDAARVAGVNVGLVKVRAYVISGITAALAGIILSSRLTSVEPLAGLGYELDAIAACVIGGASLFGGEGTLVGTFVGALVIGVLRNGLNLLDVSTYWQQVVIGVIIAVTVLIGTFGTHRK